MDKAFSVLELYGEMCLLVCSYYYIYETRNPKNPHHNTLRHYEPTFIFE